MSTLIYKRTHPGDPNDQGQFGVHDCMGRVRTWNFTAVIGVGGVGPEPKRHGLDGKVNWIGIGPRRRASPGKRGQVVTFDQFLMLGSAGPSFRELAPRLSRRMYSRNVRAVMNRLDEVELREVGRILRLARNAPPSGVADSASASRTGPCPRRRRSPTSVRGCSR